MAEIVDFETRRADVAFDKMTNFHDSMVRAVLQANKAGLDAIDTIIAAQMFLSELIENVTDGPASEARLIESICKYLKRGVDWSPSEDIDG